MIIFIYKNKMDGYMRSFLVFRKRNKFFVARCPELGVTSQGRNSRRSASEYQRSHRTFILKVSAKISPARHQNPSGPQSKLPMPKLPVISDKECEKK